MGEAFLKRRGFIASGESGGNSGDTEHTHTYVPTGEFYWINSGACEMLLKCSDASCNDTTSILSSFIHEEIVSTPTCIRTGKTKYTAYFNDYPDMTSTFIDDTVPKDSNNHDSLENLSTEYIQGGDDEHSERIYHKKITHYIPCNCYETEFEEHEFEMINGIYTCKKCGYTL